MTLSIRPAAKEDQPILADMNKRLIKDEGSRNPMSVEELRQRMNGWLEDDWNIDLLIEGDFIAGYAVYQLRKDDYDPDKDVVYLRQFYIEREHRNRGLGSRGLKLLIETRFPKGCNVVIDVLASNPRGCQFWSKVGFQPYCTTMKLENNLYRAAYFYDLDDRSITKDDIPFFLEYAAKIKGDVLELACGTGRVTIPLAEEGYNVWGIDRSKDMLNELNRKADTLPDETRQRVHVMQGNMIDFDLGRTFSLIIIPFRSFQALTRSEQQRTCLEAVRRHLSPDGIFIVDVFRPYNQLNDSWIQPEKLDWETKDPRTGYKVRRTNIARDIDVENQIIYPELIYYVTKPDGSEERIVESLSLRYYYEGQMREMILSSGFEIVEEMGYYDKRPISEGPELIFVCRR